MERRTTLGLLLLLAGSGWACAFAVAGLSLFAGAPDHGTVAALFAAFGFGAGVACAALRLALEQRLPQDLAAALHPAAAADHRRQPSPPNLQGA